MKEILIGILVIVVVLGTLWASVQYEVVAKVMIGIILTAIGLFVASMIGSLVVDILGSDSRNDDDPGM